MKPLASLRHEINLKVNLLRKALIAFIAICLLVSVGNLGIHQVQASPAPAGVVYSVPITLTNTQPVATPSPFQQMITVDSLSYSLYEASNLQNIEFFDQNGAVIPSWLESGDNSSSTDTIYWLNLANGIPAHSSATIYMGFASTATNVFNTETTGEAPQLSVSSGKDPAESANYGAYDDGANVFTNYQSFVNSYETYPAGWYGSGFDTGWSYVMRAQNGWYIANVNGHGVAYIGSNIPINNQLAVDIQVYFLQTTGTDWQAPFVNNSSLTDYSPQGYAVTWLDNNAPGNTHNAGATLALSSSGPGGNAISSSQGVFPPDVVTVTDTQIYSNYTAIISGNGILANSGYLALSTYSSSGSGSDIAGYWVRTRAYPPNGVMPSVSTMVTITTAKSFPFIIVIPIVVAAIIIAGAASFLVLRRRKLKKGAVAVGEPVMGTAPKSGPMAQNSGGLSSDPTQRLQRLKGMLDAGVISQQDYDEQKKKILDEYTK